MHLLSQIGPLTSVLETFARAGGGGSSSGGGDGGGIIGIVGFFPPHVTSTWVVRRYSRLLAAIVGSTVALVVTLVSFALLWYDAPFYPIAIGVAAVIGVVTGTSDVMSKFKRNAVKTSAELNVAAAKDPMWHEETLLAHVRQVFAQYQHDWSTFNLDNIKTYTTPHYFHHNMLMLAALKTMGRRNNVADPRILSYYIAEAKDSEDNQHDTFVAIISGQADDTLIDEQANTVLYVDKKPFVEFWRFQRSGSAWLLAGIDQFTADIWQQHTPLLDFAVQHNMYYSLDWGWLLLPKRGQLFKASNFKYSDINNHVIGQWNGVIVQLYTYRQQASNTNLPNYQIAQITLPKSYGGIIIRQRQLLNFAPKGYTRMVYEWADFNKRYVVYATDADRLASFELINPKFMADLYDKKLKVGIEVVDNVVYLYSPVAKGEKGYLQMMEILLQAFRELKL